MNHSQRFTPWSAFRGQIGMARQDITPPAGIHNRSWGCAEHDTAAGIHQPMTATVMSISTPAQGRLVLASLDIGWWTCAEDEINYRQEIVKLTGITIDRLMIHCTHTHAGPSMSRDRIDRPGGELIAPYYDFIRQQLTLAIEQAIANESDAILDWTQTTCDLACHRVQQDHTTGQSIIGHAPDIPADNTVLVGRVTDLTTGRIKGVLVNYACHPTTLGGDNTLISPDYPGQLRATVETGIPGSLCLFMQGASGELAPWRQYTGDVTIPEAHGRALGYATLSALNLMLPAGQAQVFDRTVLSGADLGYWKLVPSNPSATLEVHQIHIPLTRKPLPTAQDIRQQLEAETNPAQIERLRRLLSHRKAYDMAGPQNDGVSAWLWKIGNAWLVATPAETYNAFQRDLRHALPHHPVAVMNIVNGYASYLPSQTIADQDAYTQRVGFYEVGSLETVTQACTAVIQSQG